MAASAAPPALASVPAKIVMKGTAQMSLHERISVTGSSSLATELTSRTKRFSQIPAAKVALPLPPPSPLVEQRVTLRELDERGMTLANRRLAQQMERRPNVMAALKYKKQKSVMQRLGARARLGLGYDYEGIQNYRPQVQTFRTIPQNWMPEFQPYASYPRRGYAGFGPPRKFGYRRGGYNGFRPRNGFLPSFNGYFFRRPWRGGYGMRGGRGFGFRRGRGGFRPKPKISREELDKQLDQYMSHNKPTLDADLDAYMAELNV